MKPMRSFRAAVAVAALGAFALSWPAVAARGEQRAARREAPVPFHVGESLTYDVSWSEYLVAGTAVTTVRGKQAAFGSSAYHIVVEGRPIPILARMYNLYYKMETLLDSYSLLSQRGTLYAEEGRERRTAITRVDQIARRAFFELEAETRSEIDFAVPARTHDGLSALYALRAWPLRRGERIRLPVTDGGWVYNIGVTVGGVERVSVPSGEYEAARLTVTITDHQNQDVWRDVAVWMTTGERRLPVKMQAELPVGDFVLALREVK
jgi:hypothetical protein